MEPVIEAGVEAYRQQSLVPLLKLVHRDILNHLLDLYLKIAEEIDDSKACDTRCSGLKSYKSSSARQKGFLDGVIQRLNKVHDGLEVVEILEKWGVISKHENLAIWREKLQGRKRFDTRVEDAALDLLKGLSGKPFQTRRRTDLTNMLSFAIDKASTRDVDDSVSYNSAKHTILVHIADPTVYVNNNKDHILMKEASNRLLTIYSGRDRLSMFPEEVSTELFSLRTAHRDLRYTTTFEFQVSPNGEIVPSSMEVYSSIISAPSCITYQEASSVLNTPTHRYYPILNKLYSLAMKRREWRFTTGGARRSEHSINDNFEKAHLLVDEMMISANTVAAKLAQKHGIPVLYRGFRGRRGRGVSRASSFRGTRYTCSMYGTGTKVRDMEKGANVKLNIWPMQHAGLGVEAYVQATSPIRKFCDLIVHFQFNAMLRKQDVPFGATQLAGLKERVLEMERAAGRIDRRAKKYWSYQQLRKWGGKLHRGVLRRKGQEVRERFGRSDGFKSEWIVFLRDVKCEISCIVDFRAKPGMDVLVKVDHVNPRTSYLVAYAAKLR